MMMGAPKTTSGPKLGKIQEQKDLVQADPQARQKNYQSQTQNKMIGALRYMNRSK